MSVIEEGIPSRGFTRFQAKVASAFPDRILDRYMSDRVQLAERKGSSQFVVVILSPGADELTDQIHHDPAVTKRTRMKLSSGSDIQAHILSIVHATKEKPQLSPPPEISAQTEFIPDELFPESVVEYPLNSNDNTVGDVLGSLHLARPSVVLDCGVLGRLPSSRFAHVLDSTLRAIDDGGVLITQQYTGHEPAASVDKAGVTRITDAKGGMDIPFHLVTSANTSPIELDEQVEQAAHMPPWIQKRVKRTLLDRFAKEATVLYTSEIAIIEKRKKRSI